MNMRSRDQTRRSFLSAIGFGTAVIVVGASAEATPDVIASEIKKLYGDKKIADGKIKLELPTIAENGLVVPMSFEVESPMTAANYVKTVHFFAEGNPNPQIASFRFTPLSPKAAASIRIRLAQTQNVVVVAEMSNGDLYGIKREVKVTIGGCGG